jgi:hypothetical protein
MALSYGILGGLLVLAVSPWLWPKSWAEAERCLPLNWVQFLKSDFVWVVGALSPAFAVCVAGTIVWFIQFPAWFQGVWVVGLIDLCVAAATSTGLGVVTLALKRSLAQRSAIQQGRGQRFDGNFSIRTPSQRLTVWRVLGAWPLARGPARRSGRFLALSLMVLMTGAMTIGAWPAWTAWALALYAVVAQSLVTRFNVLVQADFQPLHAAAAHLPLDPVGLQWLRWLIVLVPLVVGQACLWSALSFSGIPIRWAVVAAYAITGLVGTAALVMATSRQPRLKADDPGARVSAWILILVAQVAMASEVMR